MFNFLKITLIILTLSMSAYTMLIAQVSDEQLETENEAPPIEEISTDTNTIVETISTNTDTDTNSAPILEESTNTNEDEGPLIKSETVRIINLSGSSTNALTPDIEVGTDTRSVDSSLIIVDHKEYQKEKVSMFRRSEVVFFISIPFTLFFTYFAMYMMDYGGGVLDRDFTPDSLDNPPADTSSTLKGARDMFRWTTAILWSFGITYDHYMEVQTGLKISTHNNTDTSILEDKDVSRINTEEKFGFYLSMERQF